MSVNLLREFLDQPLEFQETTRAILLKESKKKTKAKMKADGFFEESCRLCRKKWTEKGFKTCGDVSAPAADSALVGKQVNWDLTVRSCSILLL